MKIIENGVPWTYDPVTGTEYRYLNDAGGHWFIQWRQPTRKTM
jgi:hypothetical protein